MLGFMERFVFRNVGVVTFVLQKTFYVSLLILITSKNSFVIVLKSARFNKNLHLFTCETIICDVREGMGVIVAKEPEQI